MECDDREILLSIDKCSFGSYLIHINFLRLMLRYWEVNPYAFGIWMILLICVGVFIVSWIAVRIVRCIPICNTII